MFNETTNWEIDKIVQLAVGSYSNGGSSNHVLYGLSERGKIYIHRKDGWVLEGDPVTLERLKNTTPERPRKPRKDNRKLEDFF